MGHPTSSLGPHLLIHLERLMGTIQSVPRNTRQGEGLETTQLEAGGAMRVEGLRPMDSGRGFWVEVRVRWEVFHV